MSLLPKRFYLDSFFDDLFPTSSNHLRSDIYEQDGKYFIEIDIPGAKKENINIDCHNEYLTISVSQGKNINDESKNYIRRERSYQEYSRQFYVGNINPDDIKAEYNDGILKIVVPKIEEVSSKRKIEIE